MIGKMYEARKHSHGASDGFRGNQSVSSQSGNIPKTRGRIGEIIAKELGVGHGTVTRAADFAKGVDEMSKESPEAASDINRGRKPTACAEISTS